MATRAPADEDDPFERVMAEARRRNLGVADMMRLEALKWEFLARATPERYRDFPDYAAAILFRTHGERTNFTAAAHPDAAPAAAASEEPVVTVVPDEPAVSQWVRAHPRIVVGAGGLLGLAIAALLFVVTRQPDRSGGGAQPTLAATETAVPIPEVTQTPGEQPKQWIFEPNAIWWVLVAALLVAAGAYVLWHVRKRQRLRREADADSQPLARIAVRFGRNTLFTDPALRGVVRDLRRHRTVASDRIDVTASLRATVARAGLPTIRFGRRPLTPEYVLVAEREGPNDHLPELAGALSERLEGAQLVSARYEFFGDPGALRRVSGREAMRFEPIEAVVGRHYGATMMVVMESADALPKPRRMPDWLETALPRVRPVLLNPRQPRQWQDQERVLAGLGLNSFAASMSGLADLADYLGRGDAAEAPRLGHGGAPDLAAYLAQHRAMLLSPTPPDDERIAGIVANLERWLDAGAMDWLRTIALFPVISTGFTFFAGASLFDQTLVTHARFLAVARLPWLRTGQMPDWLRQALVRGFSPERLERATAVIHAYLMPPRDAVTSRADFLQLRKRAEEPAERRKLIARLAAMGNPLSEDTLMLGALNALPPGELDVDVEARGLYAPAWYRRPELQASLGLLAGLAIASALVPPARLAPVPHPPDATPSSTASSDAAPASEAAPAATETAPVVVVSSAATGAAPMPTAAATDGPATAGNMFYVQIASQADMGRAQAAIKVLSNVKLNGAPLRFARVQVGLQGPKQSQLRCFTDVTCAAAPGLQRLIAGVGVANTVVPFRSDDFIWKSAKSPSQYELWIAPSASPAPTPAPTPRPTPTPSPSPTTPVATASDYQLVACEVIGSDEVPTDAIDGRLSELSKQASGRRVSQLIVASPLAASKAAYLSRIAYVDGGPAQNAAPPVRLPPADKLTACRAYIVKLLGYYFPGVPIVARGGPENTRGGRALRVTLVYAQLKE